KSTASGDCLSGAEDERHLVHVTPTPVLTALGRADERMTALVVVGRGVTAGRVVAASDVTAAVAHPQVDPASPRLQALLAAGDVGGRLEEFDGVQVRAGLHGYEATQPPKSTPPPR